MGTKHLALLGIGATTVAGGVGTGIYLSQDKTTIKDKLTREKFNLISSDEEYWVAFKESKNKNGFIELIKDGDTTASSWDARKGGNALKKWCQKQLNLGLTKENIDSFLEKIKEHCKKPPLTIGEKRKALNKEFTDKWEERLKKLKNGDSADSELAADLKKINTLVTDLTKPDEKTVEKALEDWCKNSDKEKLINQTSDAIWTKFEKRCFKEQ